MMRVRRAIVQAGPRRASATILRMEVPHVAPYVAISGLHIASVTLSITLFGVGG
jgi:hypothetical protein